MHELHNKIAGWSVLATTAVVFVGVGVLAPILAKTSDAQQGGAIAVGALTSFGVYKFISGAIFAAFKSFQWLRRLILGDAFLEGTWVGHYVVNGEHRFTIEEMRQADGETQITGFEFNNDGSARSTWSSENSFIDLKRRRLIYVYTCDVFNTTYQQGGVGDFKIVNSDRKRPPNMLVGHSADMVDAKKDPNVEHKISHTVMKHEDALKAAKKIFNVP